MSNYYVFCDFYVIDNDFKINNDIVIYDVVSDVLIVLYQFEVDYFGGNKVLL